MNVINFKSITATCSSKHRKQHHHICIAYIKCNRLQSLPESCVTARVPLRQFPGIVQMIVLTVRHLYVVDEETDRLVHNHNQC